MLTVVIGLMKDHSFTKMWMMGISATLSVALGNMHPNDDQKHYIYAWRMLYAEVERVNSLKEVKDDDLINIAKVLSAAENSLSEDQKPRKNDKNLE